MTLALALASCGCGYALAGRGSFLPDYIQIVGVPSFLNKTTAFEIERVLTDPVLCEELRAKGIARSREFSWESSVARTREIYEEVARGH